MRFYLGVLKVVNDDDKVGRMQCDDARKKADEDTHNPHKPKQFAVGVEAHHDKDARPDKTHCKNN